MRPNVGDLAPFLDTDERVRWSGAPWGGIMFRGSDFFFVPFSIFWTGFIVFWNVALWVALGLSRWDAAVNVATVIMFLIVGLVFLGFGYQFLIGRFVSDARERAKTLYALTDRRAIIAKGKRLNEIRGYELTRGAQISVSERRDGSGSITFGQPDPWFGQQSAFWHYVPEFKFERIAQVRDVVRLVDEIREATPR
jgi:hypothetical protein